LTRLIYKTELIFFFFSYGVKPFVFVTYIDIDEYKYNGFFFWTKEVQSTTKYNIIFLFCYDLKLPQNFVKKMKTSKLFNHIFVKTY
jgi:hypothetical protein